MKGCQCRWLIWLAPETLIKINLIFIILAIKSCIHNANWKDSNPPCQLILSHKSFPFILFITTIFTNNSCMFRSSIILYLCWGSLWWKRGVGRVRAHIVEHGLLHYLLWGLEGFHVIIILLSITNCIVVYLQLHIICCTLLSCHVENNIMLNLFWVMTTT